MAKKKVKLNKNESENLLPIIREFNKIAGALNGLLSRRVDSKEKKI
jgi:Txe/YoeB family toxin of Txe-Axe toxin-antitoxin module